MRKVDRVYEVLKDERWFSNLSLDRRGVVAVMTASALEDEDLAEPVAVVETAKVVAVSLN